MYSRSTKGSVNITHKHGRLEFRFTYQKKRYYVNIHLADNPNNRRFAELKAKELEFDIATHNVDLTWSRYKAPVNPLPQLQMAALEQTTLIDILARYIEFKTPLVERNTLRLYETAKEKLIKYGKPISNWNEVQGLIRWFRLNHISDRTIYKYMVDYNAALNWGLEHGLWQDTNPFQSWQKSVKKQSTHEDRRPFTREERDDIITAFETDHYYAYYAPLVKFRFLTGCRTGEVTGLQWKNLKPDCSQIHFQRSVVKVQNEYVIKSTKTRETRKFPCNTTLQALIQSIRPDHPQPNSLVFPAKKGGFICPRNFTNKPWTKVLTSLDMTVENNLYRPVYCTRHTFITLCLEAGIDAKDVAAWVGNTPKVIYEHYVEPNAKLAVPEL